MHDGTAATIAQSQSPQPDTPRDRDSENFSTHNPAQHNSDRIAVSPFIPIADCMATISLFPSTWRRGTFHTDAPYDDFTLPQHRSHGLCEIMVELVSGEDSGTWTSILHTATQLVHRRGGRVTIAGSSRAGDSNLIEVRVAKKRNAEVVEGDVQIL
ncbi:MAG: hypothetical protein Q9190_000745 [Brigantiaea leucoxantha]